MQASLYVPDKAEYCLTKHTGCFHGKRDKVMATLQGSILVTLQMLASIFGVFPWKRGKCYFGAIKMAMMDQTANRKKWNAKAQEGTATGNEQITQAKERTVSGRKGCVDEKEGAGICLDR